MGNLYVATYVALIILVVVLIMAYLQTYANNYLPTKWQRSTPLFSFPVPAKCDVPAPKEGLISTSPPNARHRYTRGYV